MTFHSFPPHPAMAATTAAPAPAVNLEKPLISRFPWRLTIAGKAEYYDAAATTSIPQTLSEALVFLYVCAHPTEHFWSPRTPEHEDGSDSALPLGMDPVSLRRAIATWAASAIRHNEEGEAHALALKLWVYGHATMATPIGDAPQKKTEPPLTGLSATSTSSPMETPPAATTCSTECLCEKCMPACMPDSTLPESTV
jgi:hypothetical protein